MGHPETRERLDCWPRHMILEIKGNLTTCLWNKCFRNLDQFLKLLTFFASQKVLTYIWRKKISSNFFASTTVWKVKVGTIFWVNYMWSFSQVKWIRKGILPQTFPWRILAWFGLWNVSNLFCKQSYYIVLSCQIIFSPQLTF